MNMFRVRRIGREGLGFEKNQNNSKKIRKISIASFWSE
jgi:hypothetical protein